MRKLLVACLITSAFVGRVIADPLKEANVAEDRGDYATAFRLLQPLARAGNREAQSRLGALYATGNGVPRDSVEAIKWFRKAADQGFPDAQHNLGGMFLKGDGVPQDYAEAEKWFRKAADQGDADSQYNLAVLFANGYGVQQDNVEAYKWFSLAAARFPASKAERRGAAITNRQLAEIVMTPAQIAEAQKAVREWKPK